MYIKEKSTYMTLHLCSQLVTDTPRSQSQSLAEDGTMRLMAQPSLI